MLVQPDGNPTNGILLCVACSVLSCFDWTLVTDDVLDCRCHTAQYCSIHCLEKDTKAHNLSGECLLMQANLSRYQWEQNPQPCPATDAPLPVSQTIHAPTNLPVCDLTRALRLVITRQQLLADRASCYAMPASASRSETCSTASHVQSGLETVGLNCTHLARI